jgi:dihydroorotate dehydrogenase
MPLPPAGIPRSLRPGHILAVNLGKNKMSPADSNEDYVKGVRMLGPYADVVVINVSSPNTPGLRALQGKEMLENLLKDVVKERNRISNGSGLPKIAVKVACDLNEEELGDVAGAVRGSGVEGVIVSNTTIRREGLGLVSCT